MITSPGFEESSRKNVNLSDVWVRYPNLADCFILSKFFSCVCQEHLWPSGVQYFHVPGAILPHPGAVLPHPGCNTSTSRCRTSTSECSIFSYTAPRCKYCTFMWKYCTQMWEYCSLDVKLLHTGCGSTAPWKCRKYGQRHSRSILKKMKQLARSVDLTLSFDIFHFFVKDPFKK